MIFFLLVLATFYFVCFLIIYFFELPPPPPIFPPLISEALHFTRIPYKFQQQKRVFFPHSYDIKPIFLKKKNLIDDLWQIPPLATHLYNIIPLICLCEGLLMLYSWWMKAIYSASCNSYIDFVSSSWGINSEVILRFCGEIAIIIACSVLVISNCTVGRISYR